MSANRTSIATGATLAALGVLAAVAIGAGGGSQAPAETAAAQRPEIRTETIRRGTGGRRARPHQPRTAAPRSSSPARGSRRRGRARTPASSSWPRRTTSRRRPDAAFGACHGCAATMLRGTVRHEPHPLEPPAAGTALLCCARPEGDVVLDA
jgi:hypothetical protein